MRILLTGATGYIGKRLLPILLDLGHEIICCVRDKSRFNYPEHKSISVFEVDFLKEIETKTAPMKFDAAFYLIHSMNSHLGNFEEAEKLTALNFIEYLKLTSVKQIIYLGGITNVNNLSKHLASRKNVESILKNSEIPLTVLRAGIILGSGSASFEIIRDLVEKLPVMVTPKWLNTRHQPIAVRNVLQYLTGVLLNEKTFNNTYDIGGTDVLTYKEMLLKFAKVRGLKRFIFIIPIMTPRLSSYWLYFVTATSYKLAVNLVDSMKIEIICRNSDLQNLLNIKLLTYEEAVELAFQKIEQNNILSSWKDSLISSSSTSTLSEHVNVPTYGCYIDKRTKIINGDISNINRIKNNIWSIGGNRGWYYADYLWHLRGFIDKIFGGVGLRRGRTNNSDIHTGDTLDFWRVLIADQSHRRLLLYAEMKLPGEAWLEFKINDSNENAELIQTATFRPKGLWGRIYWYSVLPFHHFIFEGMLQNIIKYNK